MVPGKKWLQSPQMDLWERNDFNHSLLVAPGEGNPFARHLLASERLSEAGAGGGFRAIGFF